jgi:hypothetical protein
MSKVNIKNYWYSVNGKKYWFVWYRNALDHFKENFPDVYSNCFDPEKYIQVSIITIFCIEERSA